MSHHPRRVDCRRPFVRKPGDSPDNETPLLLVKYNLFRTFYSWRITTRAVRFLRTLCYTGLHQLFKPVIAQEIDSLLFGLYPPELKCLPQQYFQSQRQLRPSVIQSVAYRSVPVSAWFRAFITSSFSKSPDRQGLV